MSTLSPRGEGEAVAAGRLMAAEADLDLRVLHTSVLVRAITTAELALRRGRTQLAPGPPALAAQRAPLRRAPGAQQEGDRGPPRRGTGAPVAPQLRRPAAALGRRRPGRPVDRTRATATSTRPTCPAPSAWPTSSAGSSRTGRRRSCPTSRGGRPGRRRAGRRPRQQHPGPAQAPRGHPRRRHRRPRDPDRDPLPLPASTTCSPSRGRLPGRPRGRPWRPPKPVRRQSRL